MIIIAGNSHPELAALVALKLSQPFILASTKKFEDQELRIQLEGDFEEEDVVIIQSTSKPANDHLIELLLLADTVKRAGARRIIAVIPYFGYSRQDRPSYFHGPISASLVATLIEATGIDRIITVDLHSKQSEGFFKIGVQNLDPLPLLIPILEGIKESIVVSPDVGGLLRAQKLAALLGLDFAVINKIRNSKGECMMSEVIGEIKHKNCILIDDIIDTGGTLCRACEILVEKGAKSVSAFVTHAVLTGSVSSRLASCSFDNIWITDSIKQDDLHNKMRVISIVDLIVESLKGFLVKK